jgi:hypothetical protein
MWVESHHVTSCVCIHTCMHASEGQSRIELVAHTPHAPYQEWRADLRKSIRFPAAARLCLGCAAPTHGTRRPARRSKQGMGSGWRESKSCLARICACHGHGHGHSHVKTVTVTVTIQTWRSQSRYELGGHSHDTNVAVTVTIRTWRSQSRYKRGGHSHDTNVAVTVTIRTWRSQSRYERGGHSHDTNVAVTVMHVAKLVAALGLAHKTNTSTHACRRPAANVRREFKRTDAVALRIGLPERALFTGLFDHFDDQRRWSNLRTHSRSDIKVVCHKAMHACNSPRQHKHWHKCWLTTGRFVASAWCAWSFSASNMMF